MRPGHDTNVEGCSTRIPGRLGAVPGNINANTSAQTKTSGVNEMNKDIIEDDGFITIYPEIDRPSPMENANELYRAYNITRYMSELYSAYSHYRNYSSDGLKPCPFSAEEVKTLHRICIPIVDAILIGEKIDKTPKNIWRELSNGKGAHFDKSPVVPFSVALREVMGWK
jgi:hypothetical protein